MKTSTLVVVAALAAAVFSAAPVESCSCLPGSPPDTVCKAYALASQVFTGTVLDVTPHPTQAYYYNIRFAVDEAWKGATAGTEVTVVGSNSTGLCGVPFTAGQAYLYVGTNICGSGRFTRVLSQAQTYVETIRSGACATTPPAPTGLTAQAGTVDCAGQPVQPVVLRWNALEVDSYSVKRYVSGGQSLATIATGITSTTYSVYTNQSEYYFVSAVRGGSEGPNSNGASGSVSAPGCTTPTATATVTATASATVQATPTATATPTPTSSGVSAWQTGVYYPVGALASYGGVTYRCVQAHTSQAGWEPPNTPALWTPQ